jgi:hypothetical protein
LRAIHQHADLVTTDAHVARRALAAAEVLRFARDLGFRATARSDQKPEDERAHHFA